jgi:hypothetical protein
MKAIEAQTCVEVWLQASEHLVATSDWRDYTVILEVADPIALPEGDRRVVMHVDRFLAGHGGMPINSVVNTIFPASLYRRHGASGLGDRYIKEIYPAVKCHPDWQWGTYAQRLFQRVDANGVDIKPLETLVRKIRTQLSQRSTQRACYELTAVDLFVDLPVYDPTKDRNRPIGGPCLTHLSIKLTADHRVMLTGFYRSHYYIQRALGNLLGLAHLQHYIAKEAGAAVGPLVCHSSMAQLELERGKWGKDDVRNLIAEARAAQQLEAA